MDNFCMLIVGVGGQGTLTASKILGYLANKKGFDVKVSEVHGMSQRGGSVVTYVKFGESVFSPLIEEGEADVIIAFEALEALRWIPYLKPNGKLIANSQKIEPMPVITGKMKYPDAPEAKLQKACPDAIIIDALSIATECGNKRSVNIVLMGAASSYIPFEEAEWIDTIKNVTPSKALEANLLAFQKGCAVIK